MTRTLLVRTPAASYPISIGAGLLSDVGEIAGTLGLGRHLAIATDSNVATLHGSAVRRHFERAGYTASLIAMEAGEQHKGWASLDRFIAGFAETGLERSGWVLALGGGVVGDTAGLAAALYMRGVPLVQAPTTLLAMADASVGGKVAIDHRLGKNLVGVFKQPVAVLADLAMLQTLPPDEMANGMAEIVKAALIGNARDKGGTSPLLDLLESGTPPSEEMLTLAIEVKKHIVEEDPFEEGRRAILNLGHTFGHAFERLSNYTLKHGFAIAQGMMAAACLAERLRLASPALTERTARLLETYRLPLEWGQELPPGTGPAEVLAAMATDKKRSGGGLRFVLARAAGDVRLETGVPESEVLAALTQTRATAGGPTA